MAKKVSGFGFYVSSSRFQVKKNIVRLCIKRLFAFGDTVSDFMFPVSGQIIVRLNTLLIDN